MSDIQQLILDCIDIAIRKGCFYDEQQILEAKEYMINLMKFQISLDILGIDYEIIKKFNEKFNEVILNVLNEAKELGLLNTADQSNKK